jgi:hypothetical protein
MDFSGYLKNLDSMILSAFSKASKTAESNENPQVQLVHDLSKSISEYVTKLLTDYVNEYDSVIKKSLDDIIAKINVNNSQSSRISRIEAAIAILMKNNTLQSNIITPVTTETNEIVEILSGVIDGVNKIFKTSKPYISDSITVYVNGLQEVSYEKTGPNEITLGYPLSNEVFIDRIEARYKTETIN